MILSPLTHLLFHVDEFFTLSIVKLPLIDGITVTMNDVHPPLYYIILKSVTKFLNILNIKYPLIFVLKLLSIVPYIIILGLSGIKIRKEYGWLTAGLLVFTLASMSDFFMHYLTLRMYSWGILFLLLSFIYLKEVFDSSDIKSWILLTIFTVLGAYTHYFVTLSSFVIYILLGSYILFNKKPQFNKKIEIKKFILSVILAVLLYIPWIPSLIEQVTKVHNNYWIPEITWNYLLKSTVYFATINESLYLGIFAIIFLFLFMLIIFKQYNNINKKDNFYILCGVLVFIGTLIIAIILSLIYKPILQVRYLLPSVAVFWFAISIMIGQLKNNKILTVALLLIFIFGGINTISTVDSINSTYDSANYNMDLLNNIANDNSIIICSEGGPFFQFGIYLNNENIYTIKNKGTYGVNHEKLHKIIKFNEISDDKIVELIKMNKNKNIYTIEGDWCKLNIDDMTRAKIGNIGSNNFYIIRS